ncbi:MAG: hypothetical protein HY294_16350 [Candidatus Rokubacteria bacterium]|nr:hypothetical protein [Candidatus Rokubacteria bacterium]MBI3827563.1 hypothetical protein [Candidatus Rokubacteria bacterium]
MALRVPATAVQARLPAPWELTATASGPPRGANRYVVFHDVLLNQDAEGRPAGDASGRNLGLVTRRGIRATGVSCSFNFRSYAAHPSALPGKYRTAVAAEIRAARHVEAARSGEAVRDRIGVEPAGGGHVALDLRYRRSVPVRLPYEADVRSTVDPTIVRHYKVDQLVEAALSVLFDGSEETVAIGTRPMFVRQVS